jgi:hypothetical protein
VAVGEAGPSGRLCRCRWIIAYVRLLYVKVPGRSCGINELESIQVPTPIVHWCGHTVEVLAVEADGGSLIGMALLRGHRLTVDVIDGGNVSIEKLS